LRLHTAFIGFASIDAAWRENRLFEKSFELAE